MEHKYYTTLSVTHGFMRPAIIEQSGDLKKRTINLLFEKSEVFVSMYTYVCV